MILEKNLYGLDIDKRAYQLAYFSLMMKGRSYNRRLLNEGIRPQVYHPEGYPEGEEFGSLIKVDTLPAKPTEPEEIELFTEDYETALNTWNFKRLLHQKYDVEVTNPPYMGGKGQSNKITEFLKNAYPDTKADTFSAFIERCGYMGKPTGFVGMFTPYVWMFIQSYEKLRYMLYATKDIISLIQFEYSAFEEATVPVCTFVIKNSKTGITGEYLRLVDFRGGMEVQRLKTLEAIANPKCGYRYTANVEDFAKIPGSPVAYWASEAMLRAFENGKPLGDISKPRVGQNTGDNSRFLRLWFEVNVENISFGLKQEELTSKYYKWLPYNKGGSYRKWYGNQEFIVNWENNGEEIKDFAVIRNNGKHWSRYIQNIGNMCKQGVTWTFISSSKFSTRYLPEGFICDVAGSAIFSSQPHIDLIQGFLNTETCFRFLMLMNPTLNFQAGNVAGLPIMKEESHDVTVYVTRNISISRTDFDSFETSWDFLKHPLINDRDKIEEAYINWQQFTETQFTQLKANEEELNRIFIEIYGLQDELTLEVDDKDVTVARVYDTREDIPESMKGNNYVLTKSDVIKSLVSYAVGCMFGRYSLDAEGLAYAGGEWDISKYATYIPDKDNIIPITDEEYFEDDVVGLFCAFLKKAYGEETLEENLDFIAEALGNRGDTSREVIRNYFLKGFFKDHVKTYQKRPIYWLFDGGKADAFKALVYMHRYDADTIGRLRIDYLHRMQRIYENEIDRMQEIIDNSTDGREVTAATKRKEKLIKQLKETKEYDEKIAHLALARIEIDLDDGVKVNYEKVQTDNDGNKLAVLARI